MTVAVFVFEQTRSPFAAASTFAVSLLPSIFGRSLLAPIADRIPYKYVLIAAHLLRAVLVWPDHRREHPGQPVVLFALLS